MALQIEKGIPVQEKFDAFEEEIMNEDEIRVFENDPRNKWVGVEELSTEQDIFSQYVDGLEVDATVADDLFNNFENADILAESFARRAEMLKSGELVNIPVEKTGREYSVLDFTFMEQAAMFKDLVDKDSKLKSMRPVFADGTVPTDAQTEEESKAWRELKKKGNWNDFSRFERNFMNKCAVWSYLSREIAKTQKYPTMADGTPLTEKQIDDLSAEYNQLKQENPTEFADLKAASGKWEKKHLDWKLSVHEGKSQWVCSTRKIVTDKQGNKKEFTTKYVADKIPKNTDPKEVKTSYVAIRRTFKPNDDYEVALVDIKMTA